MSADYDVMAIQQFMMDHTSDLKSLCFRLKRRLSSQYDYERIRGEQFEHTVNNILDAAEKNKQVGDLVMEIALYWLEGRDGSALALVELVEPLAIFLKELSARGDMAKKQTVTGLIKKIDPTYPHETLPVIENGDMPFDVFLSYCRRDLDMMEPIRQLLEAEGLSIWVDRERIQLGTKSWSEAIQTALRQAQAVVVLFSPDACASEWVTEELAFSQTHKKPIFPVLLRGEESEAIPFGFTRTQWLDLRHIMDYRPEIQRLAAAIRQVIKQN